MRFRMNGEEINVASREVCETAHLLARVFASSGVKLPKRSESEREATVSLYAERFNAGLGIFDGLPVANEEFSPDID